MNKVKTIALSVIILTDRQDQRLKQAIESVAFAKEVIVVSYNPELKWSGFKRALAETASVVKIVEKNQLIEDFSLARKQALEYASHDWVLYLDSDEVASDNAAAEISQVQNMTQVSGAYVLRRDMFLGKMLKHGEVSQVRLLRLVKKNVSHFARPVHEIISVTGPVVITNIILLHNSHTTCQAFLSSVQKYARMEAAYRRSVGQSFSVFELIVYPAAKWAQNALIRLGFLDGWQGMTYVTMMTLHSLLVRVYLYELEKRIT